MSAPRPISLTGLDLLNNSFLNKGLAFPCSERKELELDGLLPAVELTLDQQVKTAYVSVMAVKDRLGKHVALRALQDENETVFYALIEKHLYEMMPIVYTPGVGEACQNFSRIWHRPRGLYISARDTGHMADILFSSDYDEIRMVIVTDGERILGLGDLGANGMGIPIGKLSLYTACGGINPSYILPVTLDVGTENKELLDDPAYIGLKQPRLRGEDYNNFIDEFVTTIKARWPAILLHWEDFAGRNAAPLLQRYRHEILSFNDDIQGTAAIATAAILSGLKKKNETLSQQRIMIVGGGSAGCGIAAQLYQACLAEGLGEQEALDLFYLFDRPGLLVKSMDNLTDGQAFFARTETLSCGAHADLSQVAEKIHPTILIGVSGQAGLFTKEMIVKIAQNCPRPLIFPLSNPTSHVEATPEDILLWTNGKAIVSTGSPFTPVQLGDRSVTIDQTNNAYIFPGLGLGALACKATEINDKMLMAAARSVAQSAAEQKDSLLPPLASIKDIALTVARAVALQAREDGLCPDFDDATLEQNIAELSWQPVYQPYVPAS